MCADEELSVVTVTGVIATLPEVGQCMQISVFVVVVVVVVVVKNGLVL